MIALDSHQGGGALISVSAVPHRGVGTDLNTLAWLAEAEVEVFFLDSFGA